MSVVLKRLLAGALIFIALGVLLVGTLLKSGFVERWVRREIVSRVEQSTGAGIEMGAFHLNVWHLELEIDDLTVHGLEAADMPPLFHADRVDVGVRIISLLGRKVALDELIVERPEVAVWVDRDGRSNVPTPRRRSANRPWRQTLFDLRVRHLELKDGTVSYNDRRTPLAVDGGNLDFVLHYDAPATGADSYAGNLQWQHVRVAAKRDVPFPFDFSAKFLLHRDSFEADELIVNVLHSQLSLSAELPSFARGNWNLKYRGRLALADIRHILRSPNTPGGDVEFSGQAHYAAAGLNPNGVPGAGWTASGYYGSRDISLPYAYFHESGVQSDGNFEVADGHLVVPNVRVQNLGGTTSGRLDMDFAGLVFRTKTQMRGVSVPRLFDALDNPKLPVRSLHWDGVMEVDSVNTWHANFKDFRTTGEMRWSPPSVQAAGKIPATARVEFDYRSDRETVAIRESEISTPNATVGLDGVLAADDSALEVQFHSSDLTVWDDFISAIRGPEAGSHRIAGEVTWTGRILGPLTGSAFAGHLSARGAQYDRLAWDEVDGDMEYSPDGFILRNTMMRRGSAAASVNLSLQFDGDWNFLPSNSWMLNAQIEHASADDVQGILKTAYPVSGSLSGEVKGSGTRADPLLEATIMAEAVNIDDWRFNHFEGQLHWQHGETQLSHGELVGDFGTFAGSILYRTQGQEAEFNVSGTGISLDKVKELQSVSMPIRGQADFSLRGNGPLRALIAQGNYHVRNLTVGTETQGDFSGQLASDGKIAHLTLASEPSASRLHGEVSIGLSGDQPVSGRLSIEQFDLDPFITAGLHIHNLTGHSTADGVFTISGALGRPDTFEMDADISRISFTYEFVRLTNDGDIRLAYQRDAVRVEQAHFHGPDTDLQIGGSARFSPNSRLDFTLSGGVNLRLLGEILPELDAQGRADANVTVQGSIAQPIVVGRAQLRDASAHYADFPAGLSHVDGDIIFNKSSLSFQQITAQSGGGHLTLAGNVAYGEGPLHYQLNVTTSTVRIRYPTGMSWLAGGTLQLSGTSSAAVLSGRIEVQRVLFAQGVDMASSFFASASDTTPGPTSSSLFLQNLAFDIQGETTPGARIEWSGAHVEMDGDVRLRGTWDRPVLLGHIHLLGGEMPFRGNTFQLTRGDINFSNPFRLDPVLNVEATTTISQYQVTIDFSGSASHLVMNYRSDPPLPDSDVVALLALGSPGEGAAIGSQPGASQNYGATALLSEAISSGVGSRIEHLFGISSFRVDPFVAGAATESNAAARVTIQEQVRHDLTITYSTNATTSNQYQLIQVEYAVNRGLSVVFLRDINGTYGLDIKWVKHLK
ncbi:MAG TPA: translocation/assembly module TamB domain-containing protein [Candidatus Acidoferrales bacterium]